MKRITTLLLGLLAVFALAIPAGAQTAVTQTTLNGAVAVGDQSLTLTSATGVVAGSQLFVDREAIQVVSISGTLAQVRRGADGTTAGAHATLSIIYAGPTAGVIGTPYVASDPALGTCVASTEVYTLRINVRNGFVWKCITSQWAVVSQPYPSPSIAGPVLGTAIASATTIAPVSYVTHVTGTVNPVTTITVPAGCALTCQIVLIPDGAFVTSAAGNISLATTAVVNKALIMTWDGSKWNPSY